MMKIINTIKLKIKLYKQYSAHHQLSMPYRTDRLADRDEFGKEYKKTCFICHRPLIDKYNCSGCEKVPSLCKCSVIPTNSKFKRLIDLMKIKLRIT